jgi:hypothetical protein
MTPPQPSGAVPHIWPAGHIVSGWQTHLLPWQTFCPAHWPQLSVPPQPSGIVPQVAPCDEHVVVTMQPQVFGVAPTPAPQAKPGGHVPQFSVPPQPSEMVPQVSAGGHDVAGVQTPPSGDPHTRLTSAPSSNVRAFSFQSSSPHSRPTWLRVHVTMKWSSSAGVFPGHFSVTPVNVPEHVTLPFVDCAVSDKLHVAPPGRPVMEPSSSRSLLTSIDPDFVNPPEHVIVYDALLM